MACARNPVSDNEESRRFWDLVSMDYFTRMVELTDYDVDEIVVTSAVPRTPIIISVSSHSPPERTRGHEQRAVCSGPVTKLQCSSEPLS